MGTARTILTNPMLQSKVPQNLPCLFKCFTVTHDVVCTECLHLSVWTSLAGAAVFRSGSACSPQLRLLLPVLAAGRAAGAATLLRPAWSIASKLFADLAMCQLQDRVLVAVLMAASFLEDSAQSL